MMVLFSGLACCTDIQSTGGDKSVSNYSLAEMYVHNNFDSYKSIYDKMKYSISQNAVNNVRGYSDYKFNKWQVDSLILINEAKSLCVVAAYCYAPNKTQERIDVFHGYEIKGNWYFKKHQSFIYPRVNYQTQRYEPMTFDMLKYLARTIELKSAYKISGEGKLTSKEDFFESNLTLESRNIDWDQKRWHKYIKEASISYGRKYSDKELKYIKEKMSLAPLKESDGPRITRKQKARIERYQKIFEALNLEHNK